MEVAEDFIIMPDGSPAPATPLNRLSKFLTEMESPTKIDRQLSSEEAAAQRHATELRELREAFEQREQLFREQKTRDRETRDRETRDQETRDQETRDQYQRDLQDLYETSLTRKTSTVNNKSVNFVIF